jgi:hypothetical protein
MKALAIFAAVAAGLAAPAASAQFQANAQAESTIGNIIDALVGNRYNVSDRQAIRQCAWAAVRQAEMQYRPDFRGPPRAYPGYRGHVRVAAITDVNRRMKGVLVRGLLDTGRRGYGNGRHGADLNFRCDVNRGGRVTDVRLERNPWYRPR